MQQFILSYLTSSIWGTYCNVNCLYSETRVMLKLGERATEEKHLLKSTVLTSDYVCRNILRRSYLLVMAAVSLATVVASYLDR